MQTSGPSLYDPAFFSVGPDGTVAVKTAAAMPAPLVISANASPPPPAVNANVLLDIVASNTAGAGIQLDSFSGGAPALLARHAGGTAAVPGNTTSGTNILLVDGYGHTGTAYGTAAAARLQFTAAENWTPTANGTLIGFATAAIGTTTLTTRMSINQGVVIGNAANDPGQGGLVINAAPTAPPAASFGSTPRLWAVSEGASNLVYLDHFGTVGTNFWISRRARGTAAAPTALQNGDNIARFLMLGRGATGYGSAYTGAIDIAALENFTDTAQGTNIKLSTASIGTTTLTQRVEVRQGVIIGNPAANDPGLGGLVLNANAAAPPTGGANLRVVAVDGGYSVVTTESFGSGAPVFAGRMANGTAAAPTAVGTGWALGSMTGQGWDGATYGEGARLTFATSQAWTGSAHGAQAQIYTAPNNSTAETLRMTIAQGVIISNAGGDPGGSNLNCNAIAVTGSGAISAGVPSLSLDVGGCGSTRLGTLANMQAYIGLGGGANGYAGVIIGSGTNGNTPSVCSSADGNGNSMRLSFWTANVNRAYFENATGDAGSFLVTSTNAYKPGGGSWTATSARELKTDIEDYPQGLDAICALRVRRFKYNGRFGLPADRSFVGLVADEVSSMPEMLGKHNLYNDDGTAEEFDSLDPSPVTWALVNAVKELAARVTQLEGK